MHEFQRKSLVQLTIALHGSPQHQVPCCCKTVPAKIHIFMPLLVVARAIPRYVFRALYPDQSSPPGTSWVRVIRPWNLQFRHPNCSNVPQGQSILHQKCSKNLLLPVDTHLIHPLPRANNCSHAHYLYLPVSSSHTARIA